VKDLTLHLLWPVLQLSWCHHYSAPGTPHTRSTSLHAAPLVALMLQVKHQPPRQAWRLPVFALVTSRQFEMVVMAVIVVNCLIMAMTHADMTTVWQDFMSWANFAFTVFFALEIVVKFVALGFKPVLRVSNSLCPACTETLLAGFKLVSLTTTCFDASGGPAAGPASP